MFAPKLPNEQTKSAAGANNMPFQRSTLGARRFGGTAVAQALLLQRSVGNQAMLRLLMLHGLGSTGKTQEATAERKEALEATPGVSRFLLERRDSARRQLARSWPLLGSIQRKPAIGRVDAPREPEVSQLSRKCDACEEKQPHTAGIGGTPQTGEIDYGSQDRGDTHYAARSLSQPAAPSQRHQFVLQQKRVVPIVGSDLRSGEGGPDEEEPTVMSSGEPAFMVQRQDGGTGDAGAPSTPRLRKTTVSGPTMGTCGAFSWGAQWSVDNATSSTNGFVVQNVRAAFDVTICPGPVDVKQFTGGRVNPAWFPFWEAWQVRGGNVFVGTTASPHVADTFAVPSFGDQSQGTIAITGTAEYFDGVANLPSGFAPRNAPPAMALPYTQTAPGLSGGTGSIPHNITIHWDCCPQSSSNQTKLVSQS
jgi:hypothetical protein